MVEFRRSSVGFGIVGRKVNARRVEKAGQWPVFRRGGGWTGATFAGCGLIEGLILQISEPTMANKIRTEADRKATPRPPAPPGVTVTVRLGQKNSLERGAHTRSKKNPGKRPKKGG